MNKLTKKVHSILGGKNELPEDPAYLAVKDIKTVAQEDIEVVNPFTGKKAIVTLNREGTTDERLAGMILHPDASREQKDAALAQYLFERGKENASFIAELYISKGKLVKETHAFKAQMRLDFELFAGRFTTFLEDSARGMLKDIGYGYLLDEKEDIIDYLKKNQKEGIKGYLNSKDVIISNVELSLISFALRSQSEADLLIAQIQETTESRLREKGFGVYIDKSGKLYSIFDADIEKAVSNDKTELQKTKVDSHEEGNKN